MNPDSKYGTESFVSDRQECNPEMMRRCKSLCVPRSRREIDDHPGAHVPFVMKAQARRNLQKILPYIPLDSDMFTFGTWISWLEAKSPFQNAFGGTKTCLPDMIKDIAMQIADEGQTALDRHAAIDEGNLPSSAAIQSYAGTRKTKGDVGRAFEVTIDDLKQFSFQKLHSSPQPRTLEWALENEKIDAIAEPARHAVFLKYCKALETIAKPAKGGGKGAKGAGKPAQPVLEAFRNHCSTLGVRFAPDRNKDIINLIAAVKARCADVY
jgi:hypothetical protein